MAQNLPALLDLDIGMASEADVAASQIATKLDLGLRPSLPAVEDTGIAGIPADAAAALARSSAMANDISDQLQANMDMGNQQAKALADAIITNVEADQTIALVADTAELKAQNRTIEVFQATGGHAAQVDRAKDAREFEVQLEALSERRADILDDEHVGIGIIDDVINGFRVQRTEQKLETTVQQAVQNQQDIVNTTVTTQSAAQTNALVKQTVNEGTIAANQRKIAAAGDADLYRATLEQNASNAETLKTMLSLSNQEISNIMRGYELAGSVESRALARERHALALREFTQTTALREISARRALIGEERERLQLQVDEGTADAKVKSQLLAVERSGIALEREVIALTIDDATLEDRLAQSILARSQAETNLDAAKLALDREQDPKKEEALQAQLSAVITAAERAEFEFDELKETSDTRLALKTGALESQKLNTLTLQRNERIASLLEEGRKAEAVALLEESAKERVDAAAVQADNATTVQAYQSFIFGAHAVETSEVINSQLGSGNPAYGLMRQLGSARGPNGEFILGTTPAKAEAALAQFEGLGVVSNDITGVRILREVRSILQKEDIDAPTNRPKDDAGLAIRFNAKAIEYMGEKGSEIVFGDATNPLQPPTIPQMVELSPTLAAQPLFSKVLIPEGNVDTNIDSIMAKGLVAMQANTLSQEQVVEGIVAMGNTIGLNNNINHHGMATVGLPYMSEVNMRVMKPRGFISNVFDEFRTGVDKAIVPALLGATAVTGVALSPLSGGLSLPVAGALGTAIGGIALKTGAGAGGIGLQGSDFTTLNIADPVAVRQHLISVLSSTTLGGEDTPANIGGE